MAAIRKIFKNRTGVTKIVVGVEIAHNADFEIPIVQFTKLANDAALWDSFIDAGTVIINNGSTDLSAVNGKLWIRLLADDRAISQSFDNSTNGFTANNTQAAIEEVKNYSARQGRVPMFLSWDAGLANNSWLGFTKQHTSDEIPHVMAWNCTLKEITYSNKAASIDGVLEIYKNGLLVGNRVYSWTINNGNVYGLLENVNLSLSKLDRLSFKWVDTGTNPDDIVFSLYFNIN